MHYSIEQCSADSRASSWAPMITKRSRGSRAVIASAASMASRSPGPVLPSTKPYTIVKAATLLLALPRSVALILASRSSSAPSRVCPAFDHGALGDPGYHSSLGAKLTGAVVRVLTPVCAGCAAAAAGAAVGVAVAVVASGTHSVVAFVPSVCWVHAPTAGASLAYLVPGFEYSN